MLNVNDRKALIAFLDAHADGDVLIQAANRVATNLEDVQSLKKFMEKYKPAAPVPESNVDRGNARDPAPAPEELPHDDVEDLGPAPKKLGSNGQKIQSLMEKQRDVEWSVDGIASKLKIIKSKVKPMLALMLERDIIFRTSRSTYRIK